MPAKNTTAPSRNAACLIAYLPSDVPPPDYTPNLTEKGGHVYPKFMMFEKETMIPLGIILGRFFQ
jgi:hypothetical protein